MSQIPQPPMPPQGPPPQAGMPMKPHRGGMILAFSLIGFFCCIIFTIIAWVMASADLKEMAAGTMDPSGEGLTRAGKIIAIVTVILAAVGLVIYLIAILAAVAAEA